MTQFPDDDPIKEFLQQHRPPTPPPNVHLESRMLAAVSEFQVLERANRRRSRLWQVSGAIAASFVAGFAGYHLWLPPSPSPAELAALEAFMESSWQSAVNDPGTEEAAIVADVN